MMDYRATIRRTQPQSTPRGCVWGIILTAPIWIVIALGLALRLFL